MNENTEYPVYPIVVSKQDPLIVRVNALSLVVGDSSFTAKVKMGTMYNGFFVYTTGIGEPITKVEVSVNGYNNTYVSDSGHTEAYNHIVNVATKWMDELQLSFTEEDGPKNLVELVQSLVAIISTDPETGDIGELRVNSTEALYIGEDESKKSITECVNELNNKLVTTDNSNTKSITDYLKSIDSNIKVIADALGSASNNNENFAKVIADAVTEGLSSMVTQMSAMNTTITEVKNTIGTNNDTEEDNTLFGTVNTINSTTDTVNTTIGSITDSDTSTICGVVNTIHNTDIPAVEAAIGSTGSATDVSDIKTTVNSIKTTVNTINSNTNANSAIAVNSNSAKTDSAYLRTALTGNSGGAMSFDNTKGWTIKTELTLEDMIVDDSGTMKVKAIVD